jgi:hypothetical protein
LAVAGALDVSPAESLVSLYASDKFYSDAESDDDDYKDPLPEQQPQHKQYYQTMTKASSNNKEAGEQLHVTMAIQRLQADLLIINSRLEALEMQHIHDTKKPTVNSQQPVDRSTVEQIGSFAATYSSIPSVELSLPNWFPFKNMNWATIAVILSWPLVAQYITARLRHRRTL